MQQCHVMHSARLAIGVECSCWNRLQYWCIVQKESKRPKTVINPRRACTAGLQLLFVCELCACVCLVQFFQTVTNRPIISIDRFTYKLHIAWFTTCFFVKQPLHKDTEFEWQLYWCTCWPFCLPSQPPEHISIHVMLFSTTFFWYGLCHCVWRYTI